MTQGTKVLENSDIRRKATEELLQILAVNGPTRTSDLRGTPKFHGMRTLSNQTICRLLRESGKAEGGIGSRAADRNGIRGGVEMADEKKKFILIVGMSGTVTVVVEAKDENAARAMSNNFQYHLGCLEDARTDSVEVEEALPWDELDKFVDVDDGMLLLDRTEP